MLHMNSAKRISIDVDIICEPGTDVIGYLNKTAQDYGFGEVVSGERFSWMSFSMKLSTTRW